MNFYFLMHTRHATTKWGSSYIEIMIRILWLLFFLISLKGNGQTITFNKAIDFNKDDETGLSVIETDSGYLIWGLGYDRDRNGGWNSCMIVKTDFEGNVTDKNFYGKWGRHHYYGLQGGLVELTDGGYAVATTISDSGSISSYDITVIKYNKAGDTVFVKDFGSNNDDDGYRLIETRDNGFAVTGKTGQSSLNDFYLLKLDSLGNFQWNKGYLNNYLDTKGWSVENAHDGGYIMSGVGYRAGYDYDTYIIKTDSAGNEEWKKSYGSKNEDLQGSLTLSSDSSYIVFGAIDTFNLPYFHGNKLWSKYVMKIDLQGNIIWRYITTDAFDLAIKMVKEIALGKGYIAVGVIRDLYFDSFYGNNVGILYRLDNDGNLMWERRYAFPVALRPNGIASYSWLYDVQPTKDEGFICTGITYTDSTYADFWLLKLDSLGCMDGYCGLTDTNCYYLPYPNCDDTLSVEDLLIENEIKVYPNPATNQIKIESKKHQLQSITLHDVTGKAQLSLLEEGVRLLGAQAGGVTININELPRGIYFCNITLTSGQTHTRKIIKQ